MRGILDRVILAAALALASLAVYGAAPASAAPGDLDTSFGTGGFVLSQFGADTPPVSIADDVVDGPDGTIYVAGARDNASKHSEVFVARYTSSGALDPSFGAGGVAIEQLGLGAPAASGTLGTSGLLRMALEPDGRIVVAADCNDASGNDEVAVMRLTTSGGLDPTFATGGVARFQPSKYATPNSAAVGIAVQPNGDIVITGQAKDPTGDYELFAKRLLFADGSSDPTFAGGLYAHQFGLGASPTSIGTDVLVEPAGDIVLSLQATGAAGNDEWAVTRLTPTGTIDPSFGTTYVQLSQAPKKQGSGPYRVRMQANGDLVLGGYAGDASGNAQYAVARFTPTGALDTSFGPSGTGFFLDQLSSTGVSEAFGLTLQNNGRIVLGGIVADSGGTTASTGIVRLTSNGTLDSSFAGNGIKLEQFASGKTPFSGGVGATTTPDGQLLLAGVATTTTPNEDRVFLARMLLDSPPSISISQSPTTVTAGQPVTFTAAASDDTSVTSTGWDLGSGHFTDASGTTATKTFSAPGTYTVRAQATDDDGLSTIATDTVDVAPPPTVKVKKIKGSGGKVRFSITCVGVTGQACDVAAQMSTLEHKQGKHVVALSARQTRHRVTIGSKSFTLAAGQSKNVTISLKRTGKNLLSQFGHVPATLKVKLGSATVFQKKITIKPPKKHKHHHH